NQACLRIVWVDVKKLTHVCLVLIVTISVRG
ncbi:MAG: hypothetical protein ACI808_002932, partial [Paraglaciecola sp.]